jgi:hypothetical protein
MHPGFANENELIDRHGAPCLGPGVPVHVESCYDEDQGRQADAGECHMLGGKRRGVVRWAWLENGTERRVLVLPPFFCGEHKKRLTCL